jgi:acetylornithine deacetylase
MKLAPAVRYLRDYVAIPSVNPMRRDDIDPSIAGERRYAEHLREQLRRLGIDAELTGPPERPSVIGEATAAGARETLLVASHLDTVPVDGMEIDPFDPRIDSGRLYGRGSCDTKGGMAALVAALEAVLARGTLRRNLLVVGESDEELGSIGARAVLDQLSDRLPGAAEGGAAARDGSPRQLGWAIATEPTELRVVTRHRGVTHAKLHAAGVAGHSSDPSMGRNAIVALARAAVALDALAATLGERRDPTLGPATLSIGLVEGGSAVNVIPDRASLTLDRRTLPGESAESVRAEIEARLESDGIRHVEVEWCRVEKGALATPDSHPAVQVCQRALAAEGLPTPTTAAAFATDGGVFESAGLASVVLGPGSILQAHTPREWVELRQVETMAAIFTRILEEAPA